MVVDGNAGCYVFPDDRVYLERSQYSARFIRLQPRVFRILRENWVGVYLTGGNLPRLCLDLNVS